MALSIILNELKANFSLLFHNFQLGIIEYWNFSNSPNILYYEWALFSNVGD